MAPLTLTGPLEAVSRDARSYPVHLLREGETGLCLFAAAFLGANDAIHMARNRMDITLVDIDSARLSEMAEMYEASAWAGDAWEFAEYARNEGVQYDVVSVDTFTGDAMWRSLDSLELWCSLARRVVTVTAPLEHLALRSVSDWTMTMYPRSELAQWLVLERA